MNVQSNTYTFIYSAVLVILAALGLAITSVSLKEKQNLNIELEKKQNILASIGVACTREESVALYDKYVKKVYALDYNAEEIQNVDAFKVDLQVENLKPVEERKYSVFECEKDGVLLYVFPLRGKGLWGPIWGYISLQDDFNTIYGTTFDHKSETPGLGSKITEPDFKQKFVGKKLFDDTQTFISVLVRKPGMADPDNEHEIDGIAGATITSKSLEAMLYDSFKPYEKFFLKNKK
jgi:Na+-transporting NADH:ubiquinone oxidoreductase subunit C